MTSPDPRAMTRVVDELFWSLRREGFDLSTANVLDAARALLVVGLEDKTRVRDALSFVCVDKQADLARFERAFDRFFSGEVRLSFWDRLRQEGFQEEELERLRETLSTVAGADDISFSAPLERGADYDRLLWLAGNSAEEMRRLGQLGLYQERASERMGLTRAANALSEVERRLGLLFGERAARIVELMNLELSEVRADVRGQIRETFERRTYSAQEGLLRKPFAQLDETELADVRRAVRMFGQRLRGAELVRKKRTRSGRLAPHATLRSALRTGGVPVHICRVRARRQRPRLVLLCDISDSVRSAATFMLEFVAAAHELFERTRSFVFVSELGETTALFRKHPIAVALSRTYSGEIVPVSDNSNYGRALRQFVRDFGRTLDRNTTLVLLGDGRSNYTDPAPEALRELRVRTGSLVWLCPEKRDAWGAADSAILKYRPYCSHLLEVATARELEDALRLLASLRRR